MSSRLTVRWRKAGAPLLKDSRMRVSCAGVTRLRSSRVSVRRSLGAEVVLLLGVLPTVRGTGVRRCTPAPERSIVFGSLMARDRLDVPDVSRARHVLPVGVRKGVS